MWGGLLLERGKELKLPRFGLDVPIRLHRADRLPPRSGLQLALDASYGRLLDHESQRRLAANVAGNKRVDASC